jgi:hypothetical protein
MMDIPRKPNEGIKALFKTCTIMSMLFVFIFGVSDKLAYEFFRLYIISGKTNNILIVWKHIELTHFIQFFLYMWVVLFIPNVIPSFMLRYFLWLDKSIPWNYIRFLDYCTERLLLQRVGGRYRFIHRLLQEHFAAMPLER